MRILEDWIIRLLEQTPAELNCKYSGNNSGAVQKEIDSLLGAYPITFAKSPVDGNALQRLHLKIREQDYETGIWDAIIFRLSEPLPINIAHDLIDRDIIVDRLGHTRQHNQVQWRLAGLVDEALLTLFFDLYTDPNSKVEELQALLDQHPTHHWLLDKWEYAADTSSSPEKEIAYHRWAWNHPGRPAEFPTPGEHAAFMASREHRKKVEQLRIEQALIEEQIRSKYEAKFKQLELEHIAQDMLEETRIESVLSSQEPDALLALAGNPRIETRWIEKLINCHHIKGARQIREAADRNIKKRREHNEI